MGPEVPSLEESGLKPLYSPNPADLFEVINERSERDSLVVTSNPVFSEWQDRFQNPRTRVRHHQALARCCPGPEPKSDVVDNLDVLGSLKVMARRPHSLRRSVVTEKELRQVRASVDRALQQIVITQAISLKRTLKMIRDLERRVRRVEKASQHR